MLAWVDKTMLTEAELERVCVVLVRARNPSNIGAVARAMHDFGFSRLRVVNEFPVPFEAAKSAVDASAVMASAAIYASVAEAVGDCTLVVGTTAAGERDLQHELVTLVEGAVRMRAELRDPTLRKSAKDGAPGDGGLGAESRDPTLRKSAKDGAPGDGGLHCGQIVGDGTAGISTYISESRRGTPGDTHVALVFGSEKTGLSNEELSHCNWLLTVPMWEHAGVRHPSMNLGQAVAVCLYELVRDPTHDDETVVNGAARGHADAAAMERLTALLTEVMERTEYTRRHAANSSAEDVRRLVRRMGVGAEDAPVWMGILRQILWKLRGRVD